MKEKNVPGNLFFDLRKSRSEEWEGGWDGKREREKMKETMKDREREWEVDQ